MSVRIHKSRCDQSILCIISLSCFWQRLTDLGDTTIFYEHLTIRMALYVTLRISTNEGLDIFDFERSFKGLINHSIHFKNP